MDNLIELYLIGMVASVAVTYIDFKKNKKGKTKEYIEFQISLEKMKNAMADLHESCGHVLSSFIISGLCILWVIVYLAIYPVRLIKMMVKLIKRKA